MRRVTSKKHLYYSESYLKSNRKNLEEHLQSIAHDGIQVLFTTLFLLPTKSSPNGPLAILPTPTYQLPNAKPLPKPKQLTKWEQFAAVEEKQEWVNWWGKIKKLSKLGLLKFLLMLVSLFTVLTYLICWLSGVKIRHRSWPMKSFSGG